MQENPSTPQVALITGAARRIGAEIARVLHQAGMNVVLHYNTSEVEAAQLCQELNQIRSLSAVTVHADLQEIEVEKRLIQKAYESWNRLDVLVNNASRFYRTIFGDVTDDAWEDLMKCNLKVPFFLAQAAAPYLSLNKGSIVNILDIHVERPLSEYAVYCISKAGLAMMTKMLAKELGPSIRVNGVAPGAILWPEGENTLSDIEKQKIIGRTMLLHAGSAADIAKAVFFFVRDADYITGQILNVDGGRLLFGG